MGLELGSLVVAGLELAGGASPAESVVGEGRTPLARDICGSYFTCGSQVAALLPRRQCGATSLSSHCDKPPLRIKAPRR